MTAVPSLRVVMNETTIDYTRASPARARLEPGPSAVQIAPVAGATGRVRVPITGMADTREP